MWFEKKKIFIFFKTIKIIIKKNFFKKKRYKINHSFT
jgi:hypothetical protein